MARLTGNSISDSQKETASTAPAETPQAPVTPDAHVDQTVDTGESAAVAGQEHIEDFFQSLLKAVDDQDIDRVNSIIFEAERKFSEEVWEKLKPEVDKVILAVVKGQSIDALITEILGTVLSGGISGRIGLGGVNVLRDDAEVPNFDTTFLEVAGKGLIQLASWGLDLIGNFFSGIVEAIFPGADRRGNPIGRLSTHGAVLRPGDTNYEFFANLPDWLHPLWKVKKRADGSIKIGGQGVPGKLAEAAGNVYALIVGPARAARLADGATKATQAVMKKELMKVGYGALGGRFLPVSRSVATAMHKLPEGVFGRVMNTMLSKGLPLGISGIAAYKVANEMSGTVLKDNGVTPEKIGEEAFEDVKYWFGANWAFTYGLQQSLQIWGPKIPYIRGVAGKSKVLDLIFAEGGTLLTIGAGTFDTWSGPVEEYFYQIIRNAVDQLDAQAIGDEDVDDSVAANRGGLIMRHPSGNVILGGM